MVDSPEDGCEFLGQQERGLEILPQEYNSLEWWLGQGRLLMNMDNKIHKECCPKEIP